LGEPTQKLWRSSSINDSTTISQSSKKMGPLWNSDYASVSGSDVFENVDGEEKVGFLTKVARESSQPSGKWLLLMICGTILNLFTMAISLATLISSRDPERNAILKSLPSFVNHLCKLSTYHKHDSHTFLAPVLDRVDISTGAKLIESDLFIPGNLSIARQYPNAETDFVWAELELTRTITISAEDVRKLGKDTETAAKIEDDF